MGTKMNSYSLTQAYKDSQVGPGFTTSRTDAVRKGYEWSVLVERAVPWDKVDLGRRAVVVYFSTGGQAGAYAAMTCALGARVLACQVAKSGLLRWNMNVARAA